MGQAKKLRLRKMGKCSFHRGRPPDGYGPPLGMAGAIQCWKQLRRWLEQRFLGYVVSRVFVEEIPSSVIVPASSNVKIVGEEPKSNAE